MGDSGVKKGRKWEVEDGGLVEDMEILRGKIKKKGDYLVYWIRCTVGASGVKNTLPLSGDCKKKGNI